MCGAGIRWFFGGAVLLGGVARAAPPENFDEPTAWRRVVQAQAPLAPSPDFSADFRRKADAARKRAEAAQAYLRVYPGGDHRDEAVMIELTSLFELGSLEGGAFGPLCERVQQYLRNPWDQVVEEEAAYWELTCRLLRRTDPATSRPATTLVRDDGALLAGYRDYLRSYPRSRYAPHVAERLFAAALRRSDEAELRTLTEQMLAGFPQHPLTEWMTGRLGLLTGRGQPLECRFRATSGSDVDISQMTGRPVLIVVWNSAQRQSRELVTKVEAYRRVHATQVIGVSTDEWRERLDTVSNSLGLEWPQFFDGLGPACAFARKWGVRETPTVLLIDKTGNLVGEAGSENLESKLGELDVK